MEGASTAPTLIEKPGRRRFQTWVSIIRPTSCPGRMSGSDHARPDSLAGQFPCQPGQLPAAPRARRQMLLYLGALARPDRAEQVNAKLVTDVRAVVRAKFRHSGCPATLPETGRDDSRPPRTAMVPMSASTSGQGERFTSRAGIPATEHGVPRPEPGAGHQDAASVQ